LNTLNVFQTITLTTFVIIIISILLWKLERSEAVDDLKSLMALRQIGIKLKLKLGCIAPIMRE